MAITAAMQEPERGRAADDRPSLALILGLTTAIALIGGAAVGFWVLYGGTLTLDLGAIVCF